MPKSPKFDLFEAICQELAVREPMIIPEDSIDDGLLEDLKLYYRETSDRRAFDRALADIRTHFKGKGSPLPFEFSADTNEFRVADREYITFISFASARRGVTAGAQEFEVQTLERLRRRLTGAIHRVGWPRNIHRTRREFEQYLGKLGFDRGCIEPTDRDGGFDILWMPPLGTVPLRPVISVQCKNSSFDERDANESVGRAYRTLQRHSHIRGHNHVLFVVFNDYIDERFVGRARGWAFVPLGLTDLGEVVTPVEGHVL